MKRVEAELLAAMDSEAEKAWDALARYKFWMFGYHAAGWVKFNAVGGFKRPNPFAELVKFARERQALKPAATAAAPLFTEEAA